MQGDEQARALPKGTVVQLRPPLYGMTFECLLKARHVALNPSFDPVVERGRWWTGHNLTDLANETGWSMHRYTAEDLITIDELSFSIQIGRYPFHSRENRSGPPVQSRWVTSAI